MKQVNKPDAALEVIKYRGYNLVPTQVGQGWRVAIFPVGFRMRCLRVRVHLRNAHKKMFLRMPGRLWTRFKFVG